MIFISGDQELELAETLRHTGVGNIICFTLLFNTGVGNIICFTLLFNTGVGNIICFTLLFNFFFVI